MRTFVTVAMTVMAGVTFAGCLTVGLVEKALDRSPGYATIRRVAQAATRGNDLYVQLDVQGRGQETVHTILLRVPIADIGTAQQSASASMLRQDSLSLAPPALGVFEAGNSPPQDAVPLPIEHAVIEHNEQLESVASSLPLGVHVLIVRRTYSSLFDASRDVETRNSLVPEGAFLTLVNRTDDRGMKHQQLNNFPQARKRHRALLLLTPFSAIGDVITSPIQLIAMLTIDC